VKVEYRTKELRLEVTLSDDFDWLLFSGVADVILKKFKGQLIERLDGFDDRYWDIEIGGRIVTLHLNNYTGLSLFAPDQETNDLVREIGSYLEGIEPRPLFREHFYLRNLFRIRKRRSQ